MTERATYMDFFASDKLPRVLVVEDDPVTAMMLKRYLEAGGYPVELADDGIVGVAMHRAKPFRIVVSDWTMPTMAGTTLCREVRSLGGSYVYFILCSARIARADRAEAFKAGVDDFLTKPIDASDLTARLNVARRILASEDRIESQRRELAENSLRLEKSNEELSSLSRKYAELFQGLPMACFAYDSEGSIREWNREAEAAFGISGATAVGMPVWQVLNGAHFAAWSEIRARSFLNTVDDHTFDWSLDRSDGLTRHFAANIIATKDHGAEVVSVVCASIDISDRKRAEAQANDYAQQVSAQRSALEAMNLQLKELAITDELTGLSNRRHFRDRMEDELTNTDGGDVSLLLLDLDHFKRVNDARGHLAGDEVLRQFARLLRRYACEGEMLARYGGEEFAVLIPGAGPHQAWLAGERYRQAIERYAWDGLNITASVGAATSKAGKSSQDELFGRADSALYVAKESGRNRVCSAEPPLTPATLS